MAEKITNIAKNTSYYTMALIIQKIISFGYFAMVARALEPDDLGRYYFAISFTTLFSIFIDIGFSNVLTREIPKIKDDKEAVSRLVSNVFLSKTFLAVGACAIAAASANLLNYPAETLVLVYLSCAPMVLDSFSTSCFAVIRGYHNLKHESVASVLFQLVALFGGSLALYFDLGLPMLMGAMVAASSVNFIFALILLTRKWGVSLRFRIGSGAQKALFALAAPFALYAILQRFFTYLDTVLLSKLAGDYEVGLYQIPFKFVTALQFLPMAFMASLYPAFSAYWKSNRDQLGTSFYRAMNYLIMISLPASVGLFALTDSVLYIFKPEYLPASLPMKIVVSGLFFMFVNYPIGALLNACDRQKTNTRNMAVVLAFSVALNLVLIPRMASAGAALTALAANALMLALGLRQAPKIIEGFSFGKILPVFAKSLAASAAMGLSIYSARDVLPLLFLPVMGAAVYAVLIYLLGAVKKQDLASVIASIKKT